MTTYNATIRHHSISRARVVECGNNPSKALEIAEEEFGDGFVDHTIVIYAHSENGGEPEIFASKLVGDERWNA